MKKYAYIDNGGTLHITKYEEYAKRCSANGKYAETNIEAKGGFPYNEYIGYIVYYGGEEVKRQDMLRYVTDEMKALYASLK